MKEEKYIDFIKRSVAKHPGMYSQEELIREMRIYGITEGKGDPGLNFAKKTIESLIQSGELEMKTQEAEKVLQTNLPKKAFIRKNMKK